VRAQEVLARLGKSDRRTGASGKPRDDLPLFAAARTTGGAPPAKSGPTPVEQALDGLNPDELTPRAALEALYTLKALRGAKSGSRR
jgi:DNA mismatch repair protein MutS